MLRQEDGEFEININYIVLIVTSCLKRNKNSELQILEDNVK